MESTPRRRLVRKRQVHPYAGRGAIYAWLRTHRLRVQELRRQQRPWALLIADMTADGIVGTDGGPASDHNVRRSWQRVLRDVAAAEAEAALRPQRPTPPSKMRGDVQPQVVPPSPPLPPAHPGAVQPLDPATVVSPDGETLEAMKKRVRASMHLSRPNYFPP